MATVKCIFAANIPIKATQPCGMHSHQCTEIVYYQAGHGYLQCNNRKMRYSPGCISIYQPGHEHSDSPHEDGYQICIGVSGCGAEKLPEGMWHVDPDIQRCVSGILSETGDASNKHNQDRLDILCGWLVLELHDFIKTKPTTNQSADHVSKARQILDARFDEQIDLQQLAGDLYISPDYLRHIFKQSIGESPLNYLIRKRLDSACEMLSITDLAIGEIACRVGLDNVYYFSRIFRKKLGVTPSQYRKSARKNL